MTNTSETKTHSPLSTPRVEALLARLKTRLTTQILLHGSGTLLLVTAGWLAFAFLADWFLHVPVGVRWFHLLVLIAVPGYLFWREFIRHLRARPDAEGLAVLLERAHPELSEVIVSAVQLRTTAPDAEGYELIQKVVAEAEQRADALDLKPVLDTRPPAKRFGLGAAAACAAAVLFLVNAQASSIFFARLFGGNVAWPQETHLAVEIPMPSELAQITLEEGRILVRTARGNDIPIIVRAEGVVPDSVTLHFTGGQVSKLAPSGNRVFRTLLRSCQEDLEFFVTGGDDVDERPMISITVLQPPDITDIAVRVTPPPYSGLAESLEFNRDIEVLAGSRVSVYMQSDPADATGIARLLPEDREITLTAATWPEPPSDPPTELDRAPNPASSFDLVASRTIRYRFEIQDETGLQNPDPGLFAINVIEDRPPEVEVLAPGRSDLETVVGGAVPIRLRVSDDFGLAGVQWTAETPMADGTDLLQGEFTTVPLELSEQNSARTRVRERVLASMLMEANGLSSTGQATEGQLFTLEFTAKDNREPIANEGKSVPVRIRIVSADELMRRLQDRLARARLRAGEVLELQREQALRTGELLSALESDEVETGRDSSGLNSALAGQRRVSGDTAALVRELASIIEALLYSRIDERADALLTHLHGEHSKHSDKAFHSEAWASLVALEQQTRRSSGLGGKLVQVLGLGLEASDKHSRSASDALVIAADAATIEAVHEALIQAESAQKQTLVSIEALLERLAEWDNFQSVLALTKDILNRQKNLLERTRQYEKEH